MSADSQTDLRDSGIVEIAFTHPDAAATFIDLANSGQIEFLRGPLDRKTSGPTAGYAFAGAPALADESFPPRNNFVAVRVPDGMTDDELAAALRHFENVRDAAPRPRFIPAFDHPTDPSIGPDDQLPPVGSPPTQWYLHRSHVPEIWNRQILGEDVIVADVDWGFDINHPELDGRFDPRFLYNVPHNNTNVQIGDLRHGTGSAGIIGAAANKQGIAGIAPACTLWLIQGGIVSATGPEQSSDHLNHWATAIDWVVSRSAGTRTIINLEIQTGRKYSAESSVAVQGALQRATAAGVFVCVPAGNGGHRIDVTEKQCAIPVTGGIVVAATGFAPSVNPRALFSNYGDRVWLAAPGEPSNDLTLGPSAPTPYTPNFGGTSGASAKVAGALALLLSAMPSLTHDDLFAAVTAIPRAATSKRIGAFLDLPVLFAAARQVTMDKWADYQVSLKRGRRRPPFGRAR